MSRTIIIAMSGFKQSGKSSVAEILENILTSEFKYGSQIGVVSKESFADPFKRIIEDVFGLKEENIKDKESPLNITKRFFRRPKSYRDLCILIGEGMKEATKCQNIWSNTIELHIQNKMNEKNPLDKVFIIPDVRYRSELKMLERMKTRGCEVYHICVFRKTALPDWVTAGLNICSEEDRVLINENFDTPRSETEWCIENPNFFCAVYNDGTKKELEEEVRRKIVEKIWK